jgi:N-acetylglucosamine malate deacetylase 1
MNELPHRMFNKVLILAPHTDDGEFGCGGSISRFVREGARVTYVAFSAAEQSVPAHMPRDILRTEVKKATQILGLAPDDCIVLNFEVRKFPELRQSILEKMVEIGRTYSPDVVFLPSYNDTHQDHQVIAQEGFRAFKRTTMLGYEVPWNNLDFRTSCFVCLTDEDVQTKIRALEMYQSQAHRSYANAEFIRSLATIRGVQIAKRYAEAFEVIRWVMG